MKKIVFITLLFIPSLLFSQIRISGDFEAGFSTSKGEYEHVFDTGDLYLTGSPGGVNFVLGLDFTELNLDATASQRVVSPDYLSELYASANLIDRLGIESDLSFEILGGRTSYSAINYYDDIMGYESFDVVNSETETTNYIGINLEHPLGGLTFGLSPDMVGGLTDLYSNVYLTHPMINAEAYVTVVKKENMDWDNSKYSAFGLDFALQGHQFIDWFDSVLIGAGYELLFNDTVDAFSDTRPQNKYGISWSMIKDAAYFGVNFFGAYDQSADKSDYALGFDASYDLIDTLKLWGALQFEDLTKVNSDTLGYEISLSYDFGIGTTAYAGVQYGPGYNSYTTTDEVSFFMAAKTIF